MGSDIKDDFTIKLVTFICTVPSIYLAIVAGIKRAHDTACSPWYSLTPLIPVFFLNIVTAVLFVAGCIFLIKDKSMEGVNEYGTNPTRPYADQLAFHA